MMFVWKKLGMLTAKGVFEHHKYDPESKTEGHHSYVIKDLDAYNLDSTLRYMEKDNKVRILGGAALDPFGKGFDQIRTLALELVSLGVPQLAQFHVVSMGLNTSHEGQDIGSLGDFVK